MTVFGEGTALIWIWRIAPIVLGGSAGYAFYRFVGCKSGSCPITSNPWISTFYGALLGALLLSR